jgi:hypothetical protein
MSISAHFAGGETLVLSLAGDTATIADPDVRLNAEKHGDEWSIGINDYEFYIIPEAGIVGG